MLKIYFIIGIIYTLFNYIMYIISQIIDEDDDSTWHEIKNSINVLRDPISTSERKKYARRNIVILGGLVLIMLIIIIPVLWPIFAIDNAILIVRLFFKED